MTDRDLEGKFRTLVEPLLPLGQVDRLIEMCWTMDELPDAGALARSSVPSIDAASAGVGG